MTKLTSSRALPNLVSMPVSRSAYALQHLPRANYDCACGSEPKTFDPLQVEDDASVAIRYLTGRNSVVRMNRRCAGAGARTGAALESFKRWQADYIQVAQRRSAFSDGTPFSAEERLPTPFNG